MHENCKRGNIFYADLSPVIGSEQGGVRPVLVVQNDTGNRFSPTVIVAAITSRPKKGDLPTHVSLSRAYGLSEDSMVMLEQIRTIDKRRLKNFIGCVDDEVMDYIDEALGISVGLEEERHPDEMELCLFQTCANQFYNSPDHIIKRTDPFQQVKDDCTYCQVRRGYDYRIWNKKRKGGA
ncbi:MAG TPA: Growth inhibitor [Ruminococcaceae bacterium]|jgi:mRNA interferase MazF|nr:Growth inhibitor [Oscillospiraceae bacterium]